ncbi:MAG: ribosome-associated translation inhibitor RaiA [Pyrinomonadaceae bacterium]
MKFEYTGRHIEVTPAMRSHVEEHFGRLKHLFDGNNSTAHIIIEVERGRHRSEIIVKWRKEVLNAATTLDDMYQALSKSIDKIEKQANRLRKKVIDKSHKAKKVSEVTIDDQAVEPTPNQPRIIASRRYTVKPMRSEEAVMALVAQEDQFLVFRNAENQNISIMYKRKDGNYGLIEP